MAILSDPAFAVVDAHAIAAFKGGDPRAVGICSHEMIRHAVAHADDGARG